MEKTRKRERTEGDHQLKRGQRIRLGDYEVVVIRTGKDGGPVRLRIRKAKSIDTRLASA